MINKIKFCWKVLRGKHTNWVFFNISDQQQLKILNKVDDVDLTIHYIGVDKEVMRIITNKLDK